MPFDEHIDQVLNMKNVFTLVVCIIYSRQCLGSINADFQTKCRATFPFISQGEALQFLSTGKRVTPRACCEEGACESYGQKCFTEQYRSLIVSHFGYNCSPGQSVAITSWCVGHISFECKDPCQVLGIEQCLNGGTCESNASSWTCNCTGYNGTICQTDIDECESNSCNSVFSERCENLPGTYKCHCKAGHTGTDCDTNINECASRPCQHLGNCSDGLDSFKCACPPTYSGVVCEIDVDECKVNPCNIANSVQCENLPGSYRCECKAGYNGTHCDTDIDDCASGPCEIFENCTDHVNSFTCSCPPGYTGNVCETECVGGTYGLSCQDKCGNCFNNRPCNNIDGGCTSCAAGYNGTTCVDECLNGTFGFNCKQHCRMCLDGDVCDIYTGECPNGCTDGYKGTRCSQQNHRDTSPCSDTCVSLPVFIGSWFAIIVGLIIIALVRLLCRRRLHEKSYKPETSADTAVQLPNTPSNYDTLKFDKPDGENRFTEINSRPLY